MNTLKIVFALVFAAVLFSCKGDPAKQHPKVKEMAGESVEALDKLSLKICKCIYEHPTAEMIETAKKIITAQDKKQAGIEEHHLLKPVFQAMSALKACMEEKNLSKGEDMSLQKDLKRLLSAKEEVADQERLDIILVFLDKNCSQSKDLYADFISTVEMLLHVLGDE